MLSFKKENPSTWIIYMIQKETESREDRNPLTPPRKTAALLPAQARSGSGRHQGDAGLFAGFL